MNHTSQIQTFILLSIAATHAFLWQALKTCFLHLWGDTFDQFDNLLCSSNQAETLSCDTGFREAWALLPTQWLINDLFTHQIHRFCQSNCCCFFNKMTEFCCLCPYLLKYLEYFIITVACVFGFSLACSTGVVLGIQKLLSNPVRSQIIVSPHPQEVFNLTQSLFLYPMCLLSSGCARF